MNEPTFPCDVFLSHSSKDKAAARSLAERLHTKVKFGKQRSEVEFHSLDSTAQDLGNKSLVLT
jgi:hypothetical protein